ncbi:ATP-binding protein [Rhodococcus sp. G-MC3]|uniref:ATP-binding protein n=1 Tax=Rhodococcus sp. G-MC3 TaxID=3046209 RepID=UPI0024BB18BE|nr:ATP-binding protein [Rhodococcus sp. G-MC3]MDJ0396390.1 ATP-binding protein [Rhodococcus sp. G-MC3]
MSYLARRAAFGEDYLAAVLAAKSNARAESGARLRIRGAGFPAIKTVTDFDFIAQPGVDRGQIARLEAGGWLAEARNVVLLGPAQAKLTPRLRSVSRPRTPGTGWRSRRRLHEDGRHWEMRRCRSHWALSKDGYEVAVITDVETLWTPPTVITRRSNLMELRLPVNELSSSAESTIRFSSSTR